MNSDELMADARVQAKLAELTSWVKWLNEKYRGINLPADQRSLLALGCLDVAMEHQMAIETLARHGLYGSMHAMLRILFEAFIRGCWLARAATGAEVNAYVKNDGTRKKFETLVEEAEVALGHRRKILRTMKVNSWAALNSFTHTGMYQITRRHAPGFTGPNYSTQDVIRVMRHAIALGVLAAIEMATLGRLEALALETLQRAEAAAKRAN